MRHDGSGAATKDRRAPRTLLQHADLRFAALLGLAAWLSDWASKSWALDVVAHAPVELGNRLLLGVVRNDALAFSTMASMPLGSIMSLRLTCIAVLAVLAIRFAAESRRLACAFSLLLAGGVGNVADLFFRQGAVVDFIGLGPFPVADSEVAIVFNLADIWIKVGVILAFPLIRRAAHRTQQASEDFERRLLSARAR
ncbi:MAG: signal peptidase II [Longimicrobiales bacterium]